MKKSNVSLLLVGTFLMPVVSYGAADFGAADFEAADFSGSDAQFADVVVSDDALFEAIKANDINKV
ncbi:MAG: hypothetical protein LBD60_02775, partial [Puniceicoccales bacterium]|nr:hypothetical protein [Puniceicoccales bacterium]